MTLIDDIKKWYESNVYPPKSEDINANRESYEVLDSSPRWGSVVQIVFQRGDEYVAVNDIEPATEMQEWGDYGKPEIFKVEPETVTVIKYRRK